MAQPFDCFCGSSECRGRISGAQDMTADQLAGLWLNGHIRELLEEKEKKKKDEEKSAAGQLNGRDHGVPKQEDATAVALRNALAQAERMVEAARLALATYVDSLEGGHEGLQRRGPTSRELSGEMGGDTIVA